MADTVMAGRPGEAPLFLRVLSEEILPFIDRTYRTTHDRGLFGFSAGGYFATYVLFTAPDLFDRYGIASPVYWWDDYAIFRQEQMFARTHATLPKQIVITAGSEESLAIGDIYRMSTALWDGPTEGLRLTTEVVPGSHYTLQGLWRAIDVLYPIVR
jgi:predicted alpha/beta superfamily hydrolase